MADEILRCRQFVGAARTNHLRPGRRYAHDHIQRWAPLRLSRGQSATLPRTLQCREQGPVRERGDQAQLRIQEGLMRRFLAGILSVAMSLAGMPVRAATTLLPNAEQCFQTGTGPLSSGSVNNFFPTTTNPKTTWQNSTQTTLNTNPIQLDANGCAIIYGVGSYRQQVYTGPVVGGVATGNLVFDLVTTDTSAYNSVFWAGLSGGTPNTITITDTGFNSTSGTIIYFSALNTNTGATTLNPSGAGAIPVLRDTTTGPVALTGGEITATNVVGVIYDATLASFHLVDYAPVGGGGGTTATV